MKLFINEFLAKNRTNLFAALMVAAIFAIPVLGLIWLTSVPGSSYRGALPELSSGENLVSRNLANHVSTIGAKPHNIEHLGNLNAAASYIESELRSLGYDVVEQPFEVDGTIVKNIEVVIDPAESDAQTLVLGAHYDSYGRAPGANDNGSGAAAALELARLLKNLDGKSRLRIRIAFFVNEEPPYFKTADMGSAVYAKALAATDENVMGMMSLETMGYYSDRAGSQKYPFPLNLLYPNQGNFIAFVGDTSARSFVRKTIEDFRHTTKFPSEGGSAPASLQGIDWSDHRSFSALGIPAFMVTDTAAFRYPHYHARTDTPDKVDAEKLARVVSGLSGIVRAWSQP
ncbi:MAG: M28 family peptidase [Sphingorhabdus sp.]